MAPTFEIEDARGRRSVRAADFPLPVGGNGSSGSGGGDGGTGIELPGIPNVVAWLGLDQGDLFVQPEGKAEVRIDGGTVDGSRWLRAGDVVGLGASRLRVEASREGLLLRVETPDGAEADDAAPSAPRLRPPSTPAPSSAPRPSVPQPSSPVLRPVEFRPARLGSQAPPSRRRFGAWHLLALLFFAALGVVAFFLFTARSVAVIVEPPPDVMAIEGGAQLSLGGRLLLRSGEYQLRASKAGYRDLEASLEVGSAANQDFRFTLEKLPDRLSVVALGSDGPLAGARVRIDGEAVGETPLAQVELEEGEHTVLVEAPRYGPYLETLEVEGGGNAVEVEAVLEPRWARIAFGSEPVGARLRVDGEVLGQTPLEVELEEGLRRYELVRAGYKPHRGSLEVVALEDAAVGPIRLRPSDGNLVISSEPAGATVTVDGTFRGRTPFDLFLAPGRIYELRFSLVGHGPVERSVAVRSGASEQVDVVLEPRLGKVQISAFPPGAELFVDGEARGPADGQVLELPTARTYRLEVKKAGYVAFRREVTPLDGVVQSIEAHLDSEAEAREKAIRPVVETTEGHRLLLIQPGRLQMGASRREPGRRANETLRQVELSRRFYIAAHEITNEQFARYRPNHDSGFVSGQSLSIEDRPVVQITWQDAARYCNWLSRKEGLEPAYVDHADTLVPVEPMTQGYRLPTEAEWAWVARYGPGGGPRKYPWGDSLPVPSGAGNLADASAEGVVSGVLKDYRDGYAATSPVGAFGADDRGLFDLGGNVAEWVHDVYAIRPSMVGGVEKDPMGAGTGEFHVIRGPSWMHSSITELRLSYRDYGKDPRPDLGFRIVRYAE